jgi:hypothetical protein
VDGDHRRGVHQPVSRPTSSPCSTHASIVRRSACLRPSSPS